MSLIFPNLLRVLILLFPLGVYQSELLNHLQTLRNCIILYFICSPLCLVYIITPYFSLGSIDEIIYSIYQFPIWQINGNINGVTSRTLFIDKTLNKLKITDNTSRTFSRKYVWIDIFCSDDL